jgi:hypothetical protein
VIVQIDAKVLLVSHPLALPGKSPGQTVTHHRSVAVLVLVLQTLLVHVGMGMHVVAVAVLVLVLGVLVVMTGVGVLMLDLAMGVLVAVRHLVVVFVVVVAHLRLGSFRALGSSSAEQLRQRPRIGKCVNLAS